MILEDDKSQYFLFEVVCYRRLERVVFHKEKVLPVVLSWSYWPSHWCAEAALEVRHRDSLMKGSLALLHNREKHNIINQNNNNNDNSNNNNGNSKLKISFKRSSQSVKCRTPSSINNNNYKQHKRLIMSPSSSSASSSSSLIMSIIRYCGQNETRLAKKILAEFSGSSLFLYCKESHQLLGQYNVKDFYWYLGIESSRIVHTKIFNTSIASTITNNGTENMVDVEVDHNTLITMNKTFNYSIMNKKNNVKSGDTQQSSVPELNKIDKHKQIYKRPTAQALMMNHEHNQRSESNENLLSDLNVPALTLVEKQLLNVCQSKDRLNFGQTLVFNNWNELYQWIRALLLYY